MLFLISNCWSSNSDLCFTFAFAVLYAWYVLLNRVQSRLECIFYVCSCILGFRWGTVNEYVVIFAMAGISVYSAYSASRCNSILLGNTTRNIWVRFELAKYTISWVRCKGMYTIKIEYYVLSSLTKMQTVNWEIMIWSREISYIILPKFPFNLNISQVMT